MNNQPTDSQETHQTPEQPVRTVTNKMKDLYDTYIRNDEKHDSADANSAEHVPATTNRDINDVHTIADDGIDTHHTVAPINGNIKNENNAEISILNDMIASLEQDLLSAQKERDDMREKALRTVAEMENMRKRTERDREQFSLMATENIFSKIISLLDDLQSAVDAGKASNDYNAMLNGLEMILAKTTKLFEERGVRKIEVVVGSVFDVAFHEALMHIPNEIPENHIVQVVQNGYTIGDKVLRHAKVITSAGA